MRFSGRVVRRGRVAQTLRFGTAQNREDETPRAHGRCARGVRHFCAIAQVVRMRAPVPHHACANTANLI